MPLTPEDLQQLKAAKNLLENAGIAAKLAAVVGSPLEKGIKMLPKRVQGSVHKATQSALMKALDLAVTPLGNKARAEPSREQIGKPAPAALAGAVTEAAKHLAKKGLTSGSAPALVRLVGLIGSRFGVVVSEKAAAPAIPILGAAGGAIINTIFIGHYQDMARGHFVVRRLEKIHGAEPVRLAYEKL